MSRIALVVVLLFAAPARGDTAKLAAARAAIEDVRYDDARRLLVDALRSGTNAPEQVHEIYLMSAATAQVLGQRELAEQYYRRVLALDPDTRLPADASPKLRDPFVAAQAYMAAKGRLEVTAERRDDVITVSLVSDPLTMVATTAIAGADARDEPLTTSRTARLVGSADEVVVRDEHGNVLRIVRVRVVATPPPPARRDPPRPDHPAADVPLVRRWQTWAIPAGVALAAGVGFALDGARAKSSLDDIVADDQNHFFADADAERRRYRRDVVVADLAFGVAGGLAVTAIVVYATRPASPPRVAITLGTSGVAVSARF